jgi:4-alpha-glucanotransferase
LSDPWGIIDGFHDALGAYHATDSATRSALLAAMGVDPENASAPPPPRLRVLRAGDAHASSNAGEISLEDGTILQIESAFPPDLPIGYHTFRADGQEPETVIVSPQACYFPESLRAWGFAAQLYAVRSSMSWGMGDLSDLRALSSWSKDLGAGLIMLGPLCASVCASPHVRPYSPCSRLYRNLLYLRIEEIPGAAQDPDLERLRAAAQRMNGARRIDYDVIIDAKSRALERLWPRFGGSPDFDRYCRDEGAPLDSFAVFCALAEQLGGGWRLWPAEYRHPDSAAVKRFAVERSDRVRFRKWIQWLLDEQLRAAACELPLMVDLPVGFDPDGADAWAYQDVLALDARIGAPPDDFNPRGQAWGLPPFVPHKLRAAAYRPFIETLRANLRHASALRIDHVMGLSRLYWIPLDSPAAAGTYVRYPFDELLAVLAVESHRARTWILGEDLGTVEDEVRARLAASRVPSYRLAYFENTPPWQYPPLSFAAVTTHDLPTLAGLWSGEELRMRREIGVPTHENALEAMRERLKRLAELQDDASYEEAVARIHAALARSPAAVVMATLEDALGVSAPPNRPGTTNEWPNWSLALPLPIEEIRRQSLPRKLAEALRR